LGRQVRVADLYKILQVDPCAEPEVIEAAYRRLARKYHPDVSDAPNAAEIMRDLNMAYEILSDETRRAEYDRERSYMASRGHAGIGVRRSPGAIPRLDVQPKSLQFGPLPKGSTQTAQLRVTLTGLGSLRGSVRPNQSWVRANVSETNGNSCSIEVIVDTARLRDGRRHLGSITIGTLFGVSCTIPITVIVSPEPKPAVRVEPEVLDFGEVYAEAGPVAKELTITNGGTGVLAGQATVRHAWLEVHPTHFRGNQQSVTVIVDPARLKPGHRYTSRLTFETNGGTARISARLKVSEIRNPLPPVDSEAHWPELISRLLPAEPWEKDLVANLQLRAQQSGWCPTEHQRALIARIKARGLKD